MMNSKFEIWCKLEEDITDIVLIEGRLFAKTKNGIYDCTEKENPILLVIEQNFYDYKLQ